MNDEQINKIFAQLKSHEQRINAIEDNKNKKILSIAHMIH